jgi:hypothetical protein
MNRDLVAVTQAEVQGMMRGMLRWRPMVTADLHGYTPPSSSRRRRGR